MDIFCEKNIFVYISKRNIDKLRLFYIETCQHSIHYTIYTRTLSTQMSRRSEMWQFPLGLIACSKVQNQSLGNPDTKAEFPKHQTIMN